MRVLVVGAGAVGQVYGYHLARGGAELAFLVRPKYAESLRAGLTLYPLNNKKTRYQPVELEDFDVLTELAEVGERRFDYVVITIPSPALRAGTFMDDLAGAVGDAVVVTLQPGIRDADFVRARVAPERVLTGLINLCAYAAPMAGENLPRPGIAYWFPPLQKAPFSGDEAAARALVAAFRRGDFPARYRKDVAGAAAVGAGLLQSQIWALECAGWDLDALHADVDLFAVSHRAAREATAVAARVRGVKRPLAIRLLGRRQLRWIMKLARRSAPMDLERFFQVHFEKVRDQGDEARRTWIALANEHDLPRDALADLDARLVTARAAADAAAG